MERESAENSENATLDVDDVTFCYPGAERCIVRNFTYRFESGKKYLIKGESGSGKTTLAKLLSGELCPVSGSVRMGEKETCNLSVQERCNLVNYAEQKSYLFHDDVLHNITLYRDCSDVDKEDIRTQMNLLKLQSIQLNTRICDEDGISGGERSRLCLLRAMYDMPKVLIADEPTSALDKKNTENVIRFLCQRSETVIIIAHNLDADMERMFDDVIVMQ